MTSGVNEEELDQPKVSRRCWTEKKQSPAEVPEDWGNPVFVHLMPGTSPKVKCWEGREPMSPTCGGRSRTNDLGDGASKAVSTRPKGVNKVE